MVIIMPRKEKSAAAAPAIAPAPAPAPAPAASKDVINKYQALCVSLDTLANAAHSASYAAGQYMEAAFPGLSLGDRSFFGAFPRPTAAAVRGASAAPTEPEDDAAAAAEDGNPAKRRKRGKNTTPKDPNAPKKPLTAYFAFAKVGRPEVVAELPGASNKEITEELATRWANMKDTGEQQPFRDQYAIEMKTYNKVLAAYKAKLAGATDAVVVEDAEPEAEAEEEEEVAAPPPKPVTPRSTKSKKDKAESSKKKSKEKATPKEKSSRKRSTKEVTPPPSAGEEEAAAQATPATSKSSSRKRKRKAAD
ncbi:hypothetical protein Dda_0692 [Drechslerella dactyloides]|uniref:HMG box domain-containing protein n=1 Tax=Drechslerella dactyloides TaxID=74499 RepID=A0AAD6J5B6_DREDA|nr:hypothetical protein Dda_0692 [Drechslerella dactyloides]